MVEQGTKAERGRKKKCRRYQSINVSKPDEAVDERHE